MIVVFAEVLDIIRTNETPIALFVLMASIVRIPQCFIIIRNNDTQIAVIDPSTSLTREA